MSFLTYHPLVIHLKTFAQQNRVLFLWIWNYQLSRLWKTVFEKNQIIRKGVLWMSHPVMSCVIIRNEWRKENIFAKKNHRFEMTSSIHVLSHRYQWAEGRKWCRNVLIVAFFFSPHSFYTDIRDHGCLCFERRISHRRNHGSLCFERTISYSRDPR